MEELIERFNAHATYEPAVIPFYSAEDSEDVCGAAEMEVMALEEAQKTPRLYSLLALSLRGTLYGDVPSVSRAFMAWEAFLYLSPDRAPSTALLTLVGKRSNLSSDDQTLRFNRADLTLEQELPAWARGRNREALSEWTRTIESLQGIPLGFVSEKNLSPISRIHFWLKALRASQWTARVLVQPVQV